MDYKRKSAAILIYLKNQFLLIKDVQTTYQPAKQLRDWPVWLSNGQVVFMKKDYYDHKAAHIR